MITEAAQAALDFGFTQRGLTRIVSILQSGNKASERIVMKLGMALERETTDPSCNRRVLVYEALSG
ncbi:MAG: GNAT family N-acetyltransferase [Pseudomonadota bacterium]